MICVPAEAEKSISTATAGKAESGKRSGSLVSERIKGDGGSPVSERAAGYRGTEDPL